MKKLLIKLFCVITVLCTVLSLCACSSDEPTQTASAATGGDTAAPTDEPTGEATPSSAVTPTPTPTPEPTPTETPTPTVTPAPTTTPTPTPTPEPTPTPTLTPYVDEDFQRTVTGVLTVTVPYGDLNKGDLLLIDKNNTFDPSTAEVVNAFEYIHEGSAPSTGYLRFMNKSILASSPIIDAFARMHHAMKVETGTTKDLVIRASYMTAAEIEEKSEDTRFGFCIGDDPMGSEHGAGIAANIAFVDSAGLTYRLGDGGAVSESNWIVNNAHRFGLIQRYTKVKSSQTGHAEETAHFRYVGIAHATYMKEHNLCLEEYLRMLEGHDFRDPVTVTDPYGNTWSVYYAEAVVKDSTSFYVPDGLVYSVSGNNYSGFIITVKGTFDESMFSMNPPTPTPTPTPAETATVIPIED